MTEQQRLCVRNYVALLNDLVAGKTTPETFGRIYLSKFKSEQIELPDTIFKVLDRLFGDVDTHCVDPSVRGSDGIGDAELLERVKKSLEELAKTL